MANEARMARGISCARRWAWHAPAGAPPAAPNGPISSALSVAKGKGGRAGHAHGDHTERHGGAPHARQCRRRPAPMRATRLIVDQAGWHLRPSWRSNARQHHRPGAAATIARVAPVENVGFMRVNWLSAGSSKAKKSRLLFKPGTT